VKSASRLAMRSSFGARPLRRPNSNDRVFGKAPSCRNRHEGGKLLRPAGLVAVDSSVQCEAASAGARCYSDRLQRHSQPPLMDSAVLNEKRPNGA
jgi:hypothetical protein